MKNYAFWTPLFLFCQSSRAIPLFSIRGIEQGPVERSAHNYETSSFVALEQLFFEER